MKKSKKVIMTKKVKSGLKEAKGTAAGWKLPPNGGLGGAYFYDYTPSVTYYSSTTASVKSATEIFRERYPDIEVEFFNDFNYDGVVFKFRFRDEPLESQSTLTLDSIFLSTRSPEEIVERLTVHIHQYHGKKPITETTGNDWVDEWIKKNGAN